MVAALAGLAVTAMASMAACAQTDPMKLTQLNKYELYETGTAVASPCASAALTGKIRGTPAAQTAAVAGAADPISSPESAAADPSVCRPLHSSHV